MNQTIARDGISANPAALKRLLPSAAKALNNAADRRKHPGRLLCRRLDRRAVAAIHLEELRDECTLLACRLHQIDEDGRLVRQQGRDIVRWVIAQSNLKALVKAKLRHDVHARRR